MRRIHVRQLSVGGAKALCGKEAGGSAGLWSVPSGSQSRWAALPPARKRHHTGRRPDSGDSRPGLGSRPSYRERGRGGEPFGIRSSTGMSGKVVSGRHPVGHRDGDQHRGTIVGIGGELRGIGIDFLCLGGGKGMAAEGVRLHRGIAGIRPSIRIMDLPEGDDVSVFPGPGSMTEGAFPACRPFSAGADRLFAFPAAAAEGWTASCDKAVLPNDSP